MAYNPINPNGQATSANSAPVVIASDQSTVPVSVSGVATASNQTGGSQKTQIVDGSGNVISSTSNALNVNFTQSNTSPSTINISVQDAATTQTSGMNGQAIYTGTPTANSTAAFTLTGQETVLLQITGNSGSNWLETEISIDGGTTWYQAPYRLQGSSYTSTVFTANGMGIINVSGCTNVRIRCVSYFSGTATVKIIETTSDKYTSSDSNVGGIGGSNVSTAATGTQLVGLADGTGNSLTSNSTTTTSTRGLDLNVRSILGTAPTTAGKVDVKAAAGDLNAVLVPSTSGGLLMNSATTGAAATAIKASAGQLYGWYIYNSNTTVAYVQIFNVASGSVTLGTTAPTISLGIPPQSGANMVFPIGMAFGTAMSYAVTATRSGSGGVTNSVDVNFFYD